MQVFYTKIVLSDKEPQVTNVIWAKLLKENKLTFYLFLNGRWTPFTIVNDKGTPNTDDDEPWESSGQTVKPNSVNSDSIVNGSVKIEDLNDEVTAKLEDTYIDDTESLYINGTKP